MFNDMRKYLLTGLNYIIAPMMVILLNWTSAIEQKTFPTWGLITITIFVFFLYLTIIGINSQRHEKNKNIKFNKIYTQKHLQDSSLFFFMVLLTGVLLTYLSTWINEQLSNNWDKPTVLILQIITAFILFFIHTNIRAYNPKSSTSLVFFIIILLLFVSYFFSDIQPKLLFVFLSIYSIYIFYQIINTYTKPYNNIEKEKDVKGKQHLIIFLSVLTDDNFNVWKNLTSESFDSMVTEIDDNGYHNWKVVLKGIKPHKKTLKKLTIISSSDSRDKDGKTTKRGSCHQAEEFQIKIEKIFAKVNITIEFVNEVKKCVDFGSFEEVNKALIMELEKYSEYSYTQTVIDFTGGQKSTSVAATLAATSYPVHCQYVDTNTYKVGSYDFKYTDPTKIS